MRMAYMDRYSNSLLLEFVYDKWETAMIELIY